MMATVLRIAAGIGKTTYTAECIAWYLGIVEVYTPTHKLATEWKEKILGFNPTKRVQVIHGRNQQMEDGQHYCQKHKLAEELSHAGFSVFPNLCRQSRGRDNPPLQCEHFSSCRYIQQFDHAEVYIYVHNHLGMERSMLEQHTPDLVVIDESFWSSCIHDFSISLATLRAPGLPAGAQALCNQLAEAFTRAPGDVPSLMRTADADGTLLSTLRALKNVPSVADPAMTTRQVRERLSNSLPVLSIRTMLHQLHVESQFERPIQSVQFKADSAEIKVHHRRAFSRFYGRGLHRRNTMTTKFLLLDASADRLIIEQFLHVGKFIEIAVERNAKVTQCYSTSCPNSRLNPDQSEEAERYLDDIQAHINRYGEMYDKVLVVGPSLVTGNERTQKEALLSAQSNAKFDHFNGLRGTDDYKDFDAMVLIGRNQPPVEAIEEMARALFFDDPEPLLLGQKPEYEARGYTLQNGEFGVSVQVQPDNRVQAVMEQSRERESEQAIDRLRVVHHTGAPKEILILSNLVLDVEVHELRSWNELAGGGNRIEQAFSRQTDGVLPLNAQWLATNYPDLWPSAEAAKKDVARKRGQKPISNTKGKLSPFEYHYKPAGIRAWSRCLSRFDDLETVAKTLTNALGSPVSAKAPKIKDGT